MIDFCIDNNLLIINGRGNDSSGCVTCKNISTVDYFLSSPSLFSKFESLYVHDFCDLFSDSHNPVSLKVNVGKFNIDNYSSCNNMDKTKLWDAEKIQSFLRNFNDDDITNLCRQIDYLKSSGSASQGDINQIVDSLNDMYISNCRSSFGTTSTSSKRSALASRSQWFNKHCKLARHKFHNAQHLYKLRKSHQNKRNLKTCSKTYKKTLHQEQIRYKNAKIAELRKIKKAEPRKFWRFLNGTRKCEIKLELDKAHDYFSKINHCQETETSDINLNFEPNENEEINIPITLEEIKKAARILKNNKSSGIDMILNEHIKHSLELPHIQQLYLKLFNLVFDTGHIPEAWSIGKIIPVYKQKGGPTDPSNYRPITLLSCMGKLFTAVINNRLQAYSEEHSKINNCQAGFRKNFRRQTIFLPYIR